MKDPFVVNRRHHRVVLNHRCKRVLRDRAGGVVFKGNTLHVRAGMRPSKRRCFVREIEVLLDALRLTRSRTLNLLDTLEQAPDWDNAIGWRPAPQRAHIAWQLMHIAITEDVFATEGLAPAKDPLWKHLWPRFRAGSVPDDDLPAAGVIRNVLDRSRQHLFSTLSELSVDLLHEVPNPLREQGLTPYGTVLSLAWHEAHHQGQAHLTLNLFRTANAK